MRKRFFDMDIFCFSLLSGCYPPPPHVPLLSSSSLSVTLVNLLAVFSLVCHREKKDESAFQGRGKGEKYEYDCDAE
jgi:hypothetical protein